MQDIEFTLDDFPGHLQAALKMNWAKRHLDALQKRVASFCQADTYAISREDDPELGEHRVRVKVKSLDPALGLILGDFVSCLRSSLDHLAVQLTRLPAGTRNDKASFPVIQVFDSKGMELFDKATTGVPCLAVAKIKELQPYNYGDGFRCCELWRLHKLWNIDKHRRIPLHRNELGINVEFRAGLPIDQKRFDDGGTITCRLADKHHLKIKPATTFDVLFGDESEGVIVTTSDLVGIYKFVRDDVFPRFASFFQ